MSPEEYENYMDSDEGQLEQEKSMLESSLKSNEENPEYEWLSKAPSLMNAEDRTPDAFMLRRYFWLVDQINELKTKRLAA